MFLLFYWHSTPEKQTKISVYMLVMYKNVKIENFKGSFNKSPNIHLSNKSDKDVD